MIHLVVAFIHEARPLIDHYRLHRLKGTHPYAIYRNEQFILIISGMGKVASAAATAYLQALSVNQGPVACLNVGIAGHSDFKPGQGFIAHRIIDQSTGRTYYPPLIFPFPTPSSDLITVDCAERNYTARSAYDMEASAYYQIALKASTIEWVHCYKIVSDNPRHPLETLTKTGVTHLVIDKMDEISEILSILSSEITAYRQLELPGAEMEAFTRRWHFSHTRLYQLKELLRRGQTLYGKEFHAQFKLLEYHSAKDFLNALKQALDTGFFSLKC